MLRFPLAIHKLTKEIAKKERRSLTQQIVYYVEQGLADDLGICTLDNLPDVNLENTFDRIVSNLGTVSKLSEDKG